MLNRRGLFALLASAAVAPLAAVASPPRGGWIITGWDGQGGWLIEHVDVEPLKHDVILESSDVRRAS